MSERTIRRVAIAAPRDLRIEHVPAPEPGAGEVLLRPLAIGVCGSDLHVLAGHHPFVTYPVLPGHEVLAEVARLGAGVDPSWRGQRVALEPSLVCGSCRACRSGRYNICDELQVMGFQAPGGMADAFAAPVDRLHRLPDALSDRAGVLVEPAAVATHAVRRAEEVSGPLEGRDVAVFGGGTIGLLVAAAAEAGGARVTVVDPDASRRELAGALRHASIERLGDRAHDAAFECVGVGAALGDAIASARKGATIVVAGVFGAAPPLPAGLVQDWELTLRGTLMYTHEDYVRAIDLLASGAVPAERFVTDSVALDDADRGFEIAARGGATLKVILEP